MILTEISLGGSVADSLAKFVSVAPASVAQGCFRLLRLIQQEVSVGLGCVVVQLCPYTRRSEGSADTNHTNTETNNIRIVLLQLTQQTPSD